MQLIDGVLMVGGGDSPDDREVKWIKGHVDKAEFAEAAGCEIKDVRHVYTRFESEEEGEAPDIAWWANKPTDDLDEPITVTFEFERT